MTNHFSRAKKEKNDEFYTQLSDIENELKHYKEHFKNKVIFCNCDDPYESNFFKYFAMRFNALGLKKLIATSYIGSPIIGRELNYFYESQKKQTIHNKKAYKVVMTELEDINHDGREDLFDVQEIIKHRIRYLDGDGDFRNDESIELLEQSDIVVTNPPFSLFREYVKQLVEYQKKFIIIGSINNLTYKDIFPLVKTNKIWLGYGFNAGNAYFKVPTTMDITKYADGVYDSKSGLVKFRNCIWLTNLDIPKSHDILDLHETFSPEKYPRYFNYDGIDIKDILSIPKDYKGVMGVPITFLQKFNPEQFEIIGTGSNVPKTMDHVAYKKENKIVYEKDGTIYWQTKYSIKERKIGNALRIEKDGLPDETPNRILIRRK